MHSYDDELLIFFNLSTLMLQTVKDVCFNIAQKCRISYLIALRGCRYGFNVRITETVF